MSLRVLVDGLAARRGGGGTLLVNQVAALSGVDGLELTVYASGAVADTLARSSPQVELRRRPPHKMLRRILWEQLVLPVRARRYDVIYLTGNFALMAARRPQVLLLQSAHHFGAASRRLRRAADSRRYRLRVAMEGVVAGISVRRAARVVAVSQSLGTAVAEDFPDLSHLDVITPAGPADFVSSPAGPPARDPYVLAVGHDLPHKDWDHLVAAFMENPDLPRLVIVGYSPPRRLAEFKRAVRGQAPARVEFRGPVDDRSELIELYRGAVCYVAHSRLESFALTPLEALMLGIPVVASDIPAHREVCGDAADYYSLDEPGELAAAVRRARRRERHAPETYRLRRTWNEHATELAEVLHAAHREALGR